MKKILYSMGILCSLFLIACNEDTGTTTEVVEANDDEYVNPANLNAYDRPGTAGYVVNERYGAEATEFENATAPELVVLYYELYMKPATVLKHDPNMPAAVGGNNVTVDAKRAEAADNAPATDANTKNNEKEVVETQQ